MPWIIITNLTKSSVVNANGTASGLSGHVQEELWPSKNQSQGSLIIRQITLYFVTLSYAYIYFITDTG